MEPPPLIEVPAVRLSILQPTLAAFGKAAQKLHSVPAAVFTGGKLIAINVNSDTLFLIFLTEFYRLRDQIVLLNGGQSVGFAADLHFQMLFRTAVRAGIAAP